MSKAIEAAELMELYQWKEPGDLSIRSDAHQPDARLADELADVLIYCLALANRAEIDLSAAILTKLSQNAKRYPVGYEPP